MAGPFAFAPWNNCCFTPPTALVKVFCDNTSNGVNLANFPVTATQGGAVVGTVNTVGVVFSTSPNFPGGSGYTSPPTVVFPTPAGGRAATATAIMSGGAVGSLAMIDPGSGYNPADYPSPGFVPIAFSGGGGSGAAAHGIPAFAAAFALAPGAFTLTSPATDASTTFTQPAGGGLAHYSWVGAIKFLSCYAAWPNTLYVTVPEFGTAIVTKIGGGSHQYAGLFPATTGWAVLTVHADGHCTYGYVAQQLTCTVSLDFPQPGFDLTVQVGWIGGGPPGICGGAGGCSYLAGFVGPGDSPAPADSPSGDAPGRTSCNVYGSIQSCASPWIHCSTVMYTAPIDHSTTTPWPPTGGLCGNYTPFTATWPTIATISS